MLITLRNKAEDGTPLEVAYLPEKGRILLDTEEYQLLTTYTSPSQENSFQLYHPKGATFVCIEPVSAQDPREAHLRTSRLSIHLQILNPKSLRW